MESANITLIGERDEANLALENLQQEADDLRSETEELRREAEELRGDADHQRSEAEQSKQRVEELEAVAEKSPAIDANSILSPISVHNDDNAVEELELLKSDMQQLTSTLERERKSRRATELELLNIKNRHDRMEQDLAATVSTDEYETAVAERDEEIESLKQQFADQADKHEVDLAEIAALMEVETVEAESIEEGIEAENDDHFQKAAQDNEPERVYEAEDSADAVSAAEEDLVESAVAQASDQAATKNVYVPKGWTMSRTAPPKKERDSLTEIKGVGPVIEKKLHECGIYYYRQVADLDESGMEELQSQIPQFPGRIKRDRWVEQAKKLQEKKYGATA